MQNAPDPPSHLLQTTATLAGVVFALAALVELGPVYGSVPIVAVILQFSGLSAVAASGYALRELWRQAGMDWRDLLGIGPATFGYPRNALMYAAWSLVLLATAYLILVIDGPTR